MLKQEDFSVPYRVLLHIGESEHPVAITEEPFLTSLDAFQRQAAVEYLVSRSFAYRTRIRVGDCIRPAITLTSTGRREAASMHKLIYGGI